MEKIHNRLPIPYIHMLENYKLASENITEGQKSFHWDVFPKNYEKAIESIDAWRTFLRNPLSLGFNDALLNFDNTRWQKNKEYKGVDAWERKRQHDYRELINEIITDKNDRQKTLNLINLLFSICGPEFVLDNLQSDIGSPSKISFSMKSKNEKEKPKNYYCNLHDLGNIYYFYQISRTVDSLIRNESPTFIEIGAGYGNLTTAIKAMDPQKILAIEKDKKLFYFLNNKFENFKNIKIINDDVLNFIEKKNLEKDMIVFGNLPYNVSTQILASLILLKKWPPWYKVLILMFQKEVADRILAKPGTKQYGRLSILSNWRLEIKKHFDVSKNSFFPVPKIISTILSCKPKNNNPFNIKNPKNLEIVTRVLFSNIRKMINKNFKKLFNQNISISKNLNLNLNVRPEELNNEIYYKIAVQYEKLST